MNKVQQWDNFSPVGHSTARSFRIEPSQGPSSSAVDWAEVLRVPQQDQERVSGWWIAAAAPPSLLAWCAIGWLLFGG